jgi:hypothetical protein
LERCEASGGEGVEVAGADAASLHQPGVGQDAEVLADPRPARGEPLGEHAHRRRTVGE